MANKIILSVLVLFVAYLARGYFKSPKSPIVETRLGKFQGIVTKSRDGRDVFSYRGIGYAKPPLGDLRFEPPEPLTATWEGVKDVSSYGAECIQIDHLIFKSKIVGDEDCLFLSVTSPKVHNAKLPVMVWFHGGLFSMGSGSMYEPDYLVDEDIVLVTVNYRLSSFGFLSTGDGIIRGNQGLKDQNLALQWVRDNIASFGGNPEDVTIFGESAGGASTHLQMLSPMSKGLFHKAIAHSGLATMSWSIQPSPAKQAKRFAKQLNCDDKNVKEMVKCLKSKSASEIISVLAEGADPLRPFISVFLPTIEKDISDGKTFLSTEPATLLENGNFNNVPLMAGLNSGEGLLITIPIVYNNTLFKLVSTEWEKTLPPIMLYPDDVDPNFLRKLREQYIDGNGPLDINNPTKHLENLTNLMSDSGFKSGFYKGIISHQKHMSSANPLYIYYYTYNAESSLSEILKALQGDYHPIVNILMMKVSKWFKNLLGEETHLAWPPCHADELGLLFKIPGLASVPKGSKDYEFSKNIVKLWVQFAKMKVTSKPKPLEFMGQKWAPLESGKPLKFMQLDISPKMIDDPDKERLAFWNVVK